MRFTAAAIYSALAVAASAYTTPTGAEPSGNPIIHPGLGELIPAGETYDITWTPTTQGNVALVLLRGPSTNVIPILTITNSTANTGSYSWEVPSTLQPDTTHYGIELVVEGTGEYQYSPQCGVSNSAVSSSSVSANASTTITLVPATYTSSNSVSSTSFTISSSSVIADNTTIIYANATGTTNYSIPVLTPTRSMSKATFSSSLFALTPTGVGSATVTFAPSSTSSTGAAVATAVMNLGAVFVAGVVGALAL